MHRARVVVDTNVLVSHLLIKESPASRAVGHALAHAQLLVSEATLSELAEVLSRDKFDRWVSREDRQSFLRLVARVAELVTAEVALKLCRDPKDDKFLELAVSGAAQWLVTGDRDLQALSMLDDCRIVTPAQLLEVPASVLVGR